MDNENARLAAQAKAERKSMNEWFDGILKKADAKRGNVSTLAKMHKARQVRARSGCKECKDIALQAICMFDYVCEESGK